MSCRCNYFQVKSNFFLKFFCQMSNYCSRHDQFLENSSWISKFVNDLIIPVFCFSVNHLSCCSFCIFTSLLSCQKEMEIIRYMKQSFCFFQIFRMFCLNCHKLINSIVNSFLDTSSCIQFFYWNEFVNFFIHAFCTVITISYSVSKYFVFFVKKNEVNAPGINTHTYRNLADFFTFFKTSNDFCKNSVEFPTEFSVFLNHTIFETMDFFKFHLSFFHVSKNQTSTGCAHIYCCIICCHC